MPVRGTLRPPMPATHLTWYAGADNFDSTECGAARCSSMDNGDGGYAKAGDVENGEFATHMITACEENTTY